jgi:hypothetical protein
MAAQENFVPILCSEMSKHLVVNKETGLSYVDLHLKET